MTYLFDNHQAISKNPTFRTWPIVVGTAMLVSRNVDRDTRALDFLGHHPLPTILLYDECKLSMRTSIRIATAHKCSNCLIRSQPTNRVFLVRHIFQRRWPAQVSQTLSTPCDSSKQCNSTKNAITSSAIEQAVQLNKQCN